MDYLLAADCDLTNNCSEFSAPSDAQIMIVSEKDSSNNGDETEFLESQIIPPTTTTIIVEESADGRGRRRKIRACKITDTFKECKSRDFHTRAIKLRGIRNRGCTRKIKSDEAPTPSSCSILNPNPNIDSKKSLFSTGDSASESVEEPQNLHPGPEQSILRDVKDIIIEAKKALHTSSPASLPCREEQIGELYQFVSTNLREKTPARIYISGSPGTGKTAVVNHVIDRLTPDIKCIPVSINCMNTTSSSTTPHELLQEIFEKLQIKSRVGDVQERIVRRLQSKVGRPVLLILDEMDQLVLQKKFKDLLFLFYEWTCLAGSRLVLIGIANTLDLALTTNTLPRRLLLNSTTWGASAASSNSKWTNSPAWKLIPFPPYTKLNIEKILEFRLSQVLTSSTVFEGTAVKFVAAKVAATTGDMRKALNAFQIALDKAVTENNEDQEDQTHLLNHNETVPTAAAPHIPDPDSLKKPPNSSLGVGVTTATMSKILTPCFFNQESDILPLQQKLLLATMLKIYKENDQGTISKIKDQNKDAIASTRLYEVYRKVCDRMGFSWIDRSELPSVCSILEDRGLIRTAKQSQNASKVGYKKNKRMTIQNCMNFGVLFEAQQNIEKLFTNDSVAASIIS